MKLEIMFTRPKKWMPISWLIGIIEGTKYSHCAIAYGDYDNKLVVHSNSYRVNIETIDIFLKKRVLVDTLVISVRGKDFLKEVMRHMGKQYGYLTIVGMGIQRLCNLFGWKIKNPFSDGDSTYVCSELVIHMLQCCSEGYENLSAERDGPKKVYEAITCNTGHTQK
jgi:hypothetical protein